MNKRLLDRSFFRKEKKVADSLKFKLDNELDKKASNLIFSVNIKDTDPDRYLKYKFLKVSMGQSKAYYNEVKNYYLRLRNIFTFIHLFSGEKSRKKIPLG